MKRYTVRQRFQRFNSFRTGYPGLKQPWARTSERLRRSGSSERLRRFVQANACGVLFKRTPAAFCSSERLRCFVLATPSAFCSSERLRCFVQANAFGVLFKRTPSAFCSSERLRRSVLANAFGVCF